MSHFSRIKTQMVVQEHLVQALKDLGYTCEEGNVEVLGYGSNRTRVEVKISTRNSGYDIGFHKTGNAYEMVADWWGIRDIRQADFLQQVTQRYAYNAARAKLEEQGFSLVTEEQERDGCIHLVLRRMT
ncbi:MAG: DUF1257 domain-containing protein [Abitibacteriaceae bacterium]|nr:DUF1257 domain-containing protein [Abditibacteriaceae bacterium]